MCKNMHLYCFESIFSPKIFLGNDMLMCMQFFLLVRWFGRFGFVGVVCWVFCTVCYTVWWYGYIMILLVAFTLFGFGLHFGPLLMYNAMD